MTAASIDKGAETPGPSTAGTARVWTLLRKLAPVLSLLLIVWLVWCAHYQRSSWGALHLPLTYHGDGVWGFAYAKALATGDIKPILSKTPDSFGAPFGANWNDYPSVEEPLYVAIAVLSFATGVFTAANLALLLAHLLAALTFYIVCRALRYDRALSAAGSVLFGLSHYSFIRSLGHLGLTYYWHLPLGMLVAYWCLGDDQLARDRRKLAISAAVALLFGCQNPYYSWLFLQFLGGAALVACLRARSVRPLIIPSGLVIIVGATFALMNADTFYNRYIHGPDSGAVVREYSALETYALKPVELFLPRHHSVARFQQWARDTYYSQALFLGEAGSPYLGFAAISGVAWLCLSVAKLTATNGTKRRYPLHFWGTLWVLAYSIPGGLNGLLGLSGVFLFRCANRYSICILALALLYLVRQLSSSMRSWRPITRAGVAGALIAIGAYDQVPPNLLESRGAIRKAVHEDRLLVSKLETAVGSGAMVFQLPAMEFPEYGPVADLPDYSQFRPYLFSKDLRFSYAGGKGRTRHRWQGELAQLDVGPMVEQLERYGFSMLLVHRRGYPDRGAALLNELRATGTVDLLVESGDYLAVKLRPRPDPSLPPEFPETWYPIERTATSDLRWSAGDADILLHNTSSQERTSRVTFSLATLSARRVTVTLGSLVLFDGQIEPDKTAPLVDVRVPLVQGTTPIEFRTDKPAEPAGDGDQRKLAFSLLNFAVLD